ARVAASHVAASELSESESPVNGRESLNHA
ncbi:MAG: hypothetical protein ACJA0V_000489, partial [Planctomycetota bacterium]